MSQGLPTPVAGSDDATAAEHGAKDAELARNGLLDGVRALAVALVLLSHSALRDRFSGGAIGVDVFFVLSGFLITVLLLREHDRVGRISLSRFYARRTLRIWPALYTFVVFFLLWAVFIADHAKREATLAGLPWVASFTSNITAARDHQVFYYMGHTWSLGVEEQFYVVWPCLLFALLYVCRRRRYVVGTAVALAFISMTALLAANAHASSTRRLFNGPDMRAEELLAGAIAGMVLAWRPLRFSAKRGAVVTGAWFLLLAGIVLKTGPGHRPYFYVQPLVALVTAATMLVATSTTPPRLLSAPLGSRPVRWVGRISYSVYLWHVPVVVYLARWERPGDKGRELVLVAAAAIGSLMVATASYYLVEKPFLRLKDRRFRNRADQGHVLVNAPAEAG